MISPSCALTSNESKKIGIADASIRHSRSPDNEQNNLSSRLVTLSNLLDSRAKSLQAAEAKLSSEKHAVHQCRAALNSVECCARKHLSDLFHDIAVRQKSLSNRESRLFHMRQNLEARFSAASQLLSDATDIGRQLSANRAELANLRNQLDEHRIALKEARRALVDAQTQRENALNDTRTLLEDRRKLEVTSKSLEKMNASLIDRETTIARREEEVSNRHASVVKFAALKRVVAPLQMLLEDLAAADGVSVPDVASDIAGALDTAIVRIAEARTRVRSMIETRAQLDVQRAQLDERKRALDVEFASLREQKIAVAADERRISGMRQSTERARQESETAMHTATEARIQLESREEDIRSREEQLLVAEDDLSRRESAVEQAERTLSRKERCISRAQAAIETREHALDRRLRDLDTERGTIHSIRKEIELREGLLNTRELELTVREAHDRSEARAFILSPYSQRMKTDANLRASGTNQHKAMQQSAGGAQSSENNIIQSEADGLVETKEKKHQNSAELPKMSAPAVRRQLAFESSTKELRDHPESAFAPMSLKRNKVVTDRSLSGPGTATTPLVPQVLEADSMIPKDDESEAAAEQLLPELVSVRTLWKERITRLEDVVQNMHEQSSMRRHIQSVLSLVAQALQNLRKDVEATPLSTDGVATHREAYRREQLAQVRWSDILHQQLNVVREVQTGMLIGSRDNREDSRTVNSVFSINETLSKKGASVSSAESFQSLSYPHLSRNEAGGNDSLSLIKPIGDVATSQSPDFLIESETNDTMELSTQRSGQIELHMHGDNDKVQLLGADNCLPFYLRNENEIS